MDRLGSEEPLAIVGASAIYPGVETVRDLWMRTLCRQGSFAPMKAVPWARSVAPGPYLASLFDGGTVDVAQFGIPPSQKASIARLQTLSVRAARACIDDARGPIDRERTDVLCGTMLGTDRHLVNALRVHAGIVAQAAVVEARTTGAGEELTARLGEIRRALERGLEGTAHDRIGEMAATVAARIALLHKTRGRTLALEAADGTSFALLDAAALALRAGDCNAALVVAAQLVESTLLVKLLAAKGLLASGPLRAFTSSGQGFLLGEGAAALLLKRRASAVDDGDRIYATLTGIAQGHDAKAGTFRYSTSLDLRAQVIDRACREAGASALQLVEVFGSGLDAEVTTERDALRARSWQPNGTPSGDGSSFARSCVKTTLGHTLANAGLAAVLHAALALHHRRLPPPPIGDCGRASHSPGGETWPDPPDGGPRRAGVSGASMIGGVAFVVLEEHRTADARSLGTTRFGRRAPAHASGVSPSDRAAQGGVAIVGIGGRFGDADSADAYWEHVRGKQDSVRPLPAGMLDRDVHYLAERLVPGRSYSDAGSWLAVPEQPPGGVAITPRRYSSLDPAQRLALHVFRELLAGAPSQGLKGRGVVIVGSNLCLSVERAVSNALHYPALEVALESCGPFAELKEPVRARVRTALRRRFGLDPVGIDVASLDGALASGIAATIANVLGTDARPLAAEAACASSLAALDLAVRELSSGRCDFAVAGGVELACNARELVLCSALRLLSRTRIRPFDASGDGFSPGDGIALFALRRVADARADGDRIFGIIRAVGASTDARSLIAPDVDGQALAMERAFEGVDFGPAAVQYLEAHGTGTRLGDPTEVNAIARVYGRESRRRALAIGSGKGAIGHTFAAAGAAGLLRTVLAMRHRTFPPTVGVVEVNPALPLRDVPAFVCAEAAPWTVDGREPRRAGVSSFGTGGINYHVLVEEGSRLQGE